MTTPFAMLALMAAPWLVARLWAALARRRFDARGAGALGLGLLFLFTGLGHFTATASMAEMLPRWVPARVPLVYTTGVLELAVALGFFVPRTRRLAGLAAAVLLVAFLPVNVHAAFARAPVGGHAWGPGYLLVRVPLQAAILLWVLHFAVRARAAGGTPAAAAVP